MPIVARVHRQIVPNQEYATVILVQLTARRLQYFNIMSLVCVTTVLMR